MKKNNASYFLFPISYFLSQISFASAGPVEGVYQLSDGLREVIRILIQFISETILQINAFDELLFYRIILFAIILLVVYTVLKKNEILGDKESILWIIASAISILAIRFIPTELLKFALYQYGTLGASLAIFFPFIVFLFFLHQSNIGPMSRKIGWVFFGVSYIAIWVFTKNEVKGLTQYLYWGGILAVAICYIFDRQIHAQFGTMELQKSKREHEAERYAFLEEKIRDIDSRLAGGTLPTSIRKTLEKRRKHFYKELSKIIKSL